MTVQPEELHLAAEFPPGTRDQWRRLAADVLRRSGAGTGAPEEALSAATYDGLTIAPLYDAGDLPGDPGLPGFAPYTRGARAEGGVVSGWDVRQRHSHPDPEVTREAVLADLENGVTSVWLVLGEAGLDPGALPAASWPGCYLDLAPVALDAGPARRRRPRRSCGWPPRAAPTRRAAAASAPTRSACAPARASPYRSPEPSTSPDAPWRAPAAGGHRRRHRRTTTPAAPTPRSSAAPSRPGWPTCAPSPTAG